MDCDLTKAVPTTEEDQDVIYLVTMVAIRHRRASTNEMLPGDRRQHSSSPAQLRVGEEMESGGVAIADVDNSAPRSSTPTHSTACPIERLSSNVR